MRREKSLKLNKLRDQIDKIDQEILLLFKRRFAIVKKIKIIKKEENLPIEDKKRETDILEQLVKNTQNLIINRHFALKLFKMIISESKRIQKDC